MSETQTLEVQKNQVALVVPDVEKVKQELQLVDPKNTIALVTADDPLNDKAEQYVHQMLAVNPEDFEAKDQYKTAVDTMGLDLQKEAARRSEMLKKPIMLLSKRGVDGGPVANALVDLKTNVEALDPGEFDFEQGWFGRTLSHLPGVGTTLNRYFTKYESADSVIAAIVRSLHEGQEMLKRDNMTLAIDQREMRVLTLKLQKTIRLAHMIDQRLEYEIERNLPAEDPRHTFAQEELLYPLRQRTMDLQQQLAVNQQGVLALELLIRNNRELIRGVDRAVNVTVTALNVAVEVALALADQKIVLTTIQSVNETTDHLIAEVAEKLHTQGVEVHKQSASAQLNMENLKEAFRKTNSAFQELSEFRQKALPEMARTILELDDLTGKAEQTIQKMEQGNKVARQFVIEVQ